MGIGGKRWAVFSTNATILHYITLKCRTVTPEAAGASPVTPATLFLNNYNSLLALGVHAPGAIFLFVEVFVEVFLLHPLLYVMLSVLLRLREQFFVNLWIFKGKKALLENQ